MGYKITVDTGGTFVDVALTDESGNLVIGKSPTESTGFAGVAGALGQIGEQLQQSVTDILSATEVFIASTTRATNAIVERRTARTILLVTEGFPDVLGLRDGGKLGMFDHRHPFPEPYVPRALTWEVPERIEFDGEIARELDEETVRRLLTRAADLSVSAVAVCLLSSHVNPVHELQLGHLLDDLLPGVPYTLSHAVNPVIGEFRRASSAAIDASLKPLMHAYLADYARDLRGAGFTGELLMATSLGGVVPIEDVADRPILAVRSGPSLAPTAGILYAQAEADLETKPDVLICDAGGTSFDVSLARQGEVALTRDTWLGPEFLGDLTGMASVDIRSIGAGGGSIAWIDGGGLLRIGPESAGAYPGPACYGRGGDRPTVTDAACVLGYLDPEAFLGGRMRLDLRAADRCLQRLGDDLRLTAAEAASAVVALFNDHMVGAIEAITVDQGVDPRECQLVAGGGAAGLSAVELGRQLEAKSVLVPRTAGALSAVGGQFSLMTTEFTMSFFTSTGEFDVPQVNGILAGLTEQAREHAGRLGTKVRDARATYFVDARYQYQNWVLEIPLNACAFRTAADVDRLVTVFHDEHERVRGVSQPGANVECLSWRVRWHATFGKSSELPAWARASEESTAAAPVATRPAYFGGEVYETAHYLGPGLAPGVEIAGPAVVAEPVTTVVLPPGATLTVTKRGNFAIRSVR